MPSSNRFENAIDRGAALLFLPLTRAKGRSLPVRVLAFVCLPLWLCIWGVPFAVLGFICMMASVALEMWEDMR